MAINIQSPVNIQELDKVNHFFSSEMYAAESMSALKALYEKAQKISTELMEDAREMSDDALVYEQLQKKSQELVNECNTIYEERIKMLPETKELAKNALWSSGNVVIAALGIASLFVVPVPGLNIVLGSAALAYGLVSFANKSKKLTQDVESEKSLAVKAESGARFVNASAEVAFGVIGLVLLTGVAPYLAVPIALGALAPVLVESSFQLNNYLASKKEEKQAVKEGNEQQDKLNSLMENIKKVGLDPHSLVHAVNAVLQHAEKMPELFSRHNDDNDSHELSKDKMKNPELESEMASQVFGASQNLSDTQEASDQGSSNNNRSL